MKCPLVNFEKFGFYILLEREKHSVAVRMRNFLKESGK